MKVKTFTGRTQQEVMKEAKDALGDDIILLESKNIDSGTEKGRLIQITVADDSDTRNTVAIKRNPTEPSLNGNNPQKSQFKALYESYSRAQRDENLARELRSLNQEIKQLKHRIEQTANPGFPKPYLAAYQYLLDIGVSTIVAHNYVQQTYFAMRYEESITTEDILSMIQSKVLKLLKSRTSKFLSKKGLPHIMALVGPTGVGKTTTIMKMALNPEIFGNKKIGIISTDTYRIGGVAPLRSFSKISRVEVREAGDNYTLLKQLKDMRHLDHILIDTPGRSPYFPKYILDLKNLLSGIADLHVSLVISMTTDINDIFLELGLYQPLIFDGLVLTKVDETCQKARLISILDESETPIEFICSGQEIPSDIHPGSSETLFNKIFN